MIGFTLRRQVRFYLRALKARYRNQRAELLFIRNHLRRSDIVCDVGANKGSFVFWLARWCSSGAVIAFEPQPQFAHLLKELCRFLKNVTVEDMAVYSRSGTFNLHVPRGHSPGASMVKLHETSCDTVSIRAVTLDEYFAPHQQIALIKIDVEGAELEVFKGAKRILRDHAPLLLFECERRHLSDGKIETVFSYLEQFGYDGHFFYQGRLLPISEFDCSRHQQQKGEWFWKLPGYCNNFVFAKCPV